jgi:hypothetical protein
MNLSGTPLIGPSRFAARWQAGSIGARINLRDITFDHILVSGPISIQMICNHDRALNCDSVTSCHDEDCKNVCFEHRICFDREVRSLSRQHHGQVTVAIQAPLMWRRMLLSPLGCSSSLLLRLRCLLQPPRHRSCPGSGQCRRGRGGFKRRRRRLLEPRRPRRRTHIFARHLRRAGRTAGARVHLRVSRWTPCKAVGGRGRFAP